MTKAILKLVGSIVLVLVLAVVLQALMPRHIDWSLSYSKNHNSPYGCSLLYDILPAVFDGGNAEVQAVTLYERSIDEKLNAHNLHLFVSASFAPDQRSLDRMMLSLRKGSTVFVSAAGFAKDVWDSVGFRLTWVWASDSSRVHFMAPSSKQHTFLVPGQALTCCFDSLASSATVLACNDDNQPVFVRFAIGEGSLYVCTLPTMFTNYALSDDTLREFSMEVLSKLPNRPPIWDEYYKPKHHDEGSMFRVLFRDSRLKSAYYIVLFTMIVFVALHMKRRERVIPLITPLANSTRDFVTTVGQLYYEHRDSTSMIRRMTQYFFEDLRSRYYIDSLSYNDESVQRVASKCGLPFSDVRELFQELQRESDNVFANDKDVMRMHKRIAEFWKAAANRGAPSTMSESL